MFLNKIVFFQSRSSAETLKGEKVEKNLIVAKGCLEYRTIFIPFKKSFLCDGIHTFSEQHHSGGAQL